MQTTEHCPILREGVWLYADSVPVAVRVLLSAEVWGSGDYKVDESVHESRQVGDIFWPTKWPGRRGISVI